MNKTAHTISQLKMLAHGMFSTAAIQGFSKDRAQAVSMYIEAARIYGLSGGDLNWTVSQCLAWGGYGGGL